jgi:hypothetical protein
MIPDAAAELECCLADEARVKRWVGEEQAQLLADEELA